MPITGPDGFGDDVGEIHRELTMGRVAAVDKTIGLRNRTLAFCVQVPECAVVSEMDRLGYHLSDPL
jgi:hypothetical protein